MVAEHLSQTAPDLLVQEHRFIVNNADRESLVVFLEQNDELLNRTVYASDPELSFIPLRAINEVMVRD